MDLDLAILFLEIYPNKIKGSEHSVSTAMLIIALCAVVKNLKQSECSTIEVLNKLQCI